MVTAEELREKGWALVSTGVTPGVLEELRNTIFAAGSAGTRCLLDLPLVREVAITLRNDLVATQLQSKSSVAIQAIAFDKTPETNWKVAWHQDVMFPLAKVATSQGYDLLSKKSGVDYARPPLTVLEDLLAVRLHLDDCDASSGPLRICPGTHLQGLIPSQDAGAVASEKGSTPCLAKEGEALLMKPLLLHASSQADTPSHRRVLHLVYHSGAPVPEAWHRNV